MKDSEIFSWLKHNNDYIHIVKDDYDVSFNVYVKDAEKRIYIAFEETQQKSDWKSNFDFPVMKYDTLLVHRGFAKQYDICRAKVREMAMIAIKQNPDYRIVCTGWSLGGALALLCAEDIGYMTGIKVTLLTFGAPKVCGDFNTVKRVRVHLTPDSVEYRNINDLVPYLPPICFFHVAADTLGKFNILKLFHPSEEHSRYDELLAKEGL